MQVKSNGNLITVKEPESISKKNIFQTNDMVCGTYWLLDEEENIKFKLNTTQVKILKIAMAMINPSLDIQEEYSFTVDEFMKILCIKDKTLQYIGLPEFLSSLMANDNFKYKDVKGNLKIFHIFDYVEYKQEEKQIDFRFSYSIIKKINGISDETSCIPYTKYRLNNILSFRSLYSINLYELLKSQSYKKEFIISLEDLRVALDVPEDKYKQYKEFNRNILDKSVKDINLQTDLNVSAEGLKHGKKVYAIKFIIITKKSSKIIEEPSKTPGEEQNFEFEKEIKEILHQEKISQEDYIKILKVAKNDIELIKEKYQIVCEYRKRNAIGNIVATIITAINENWKSSSKINKSSFNHFKQRDYDFVDLKNKLLGWDRYEEVSE